jgi:hypothetical protein
MDKQDAPGMDQKARSPCSAGGDKGCGPSLNDWLYFVSLILLGVSLPDGTCAWKRRMAKWAWFHRENLSCSLGFMLVALFRAMG